MSHNQPLSPEQKAQIAQQIGQAEQWLGQKEQVLRSLQQQFAGAKKNKQQELQNQIAGAQQEYNAALNQVNTLRAQIGSPLIIPGSPGAFAPQPAFVQQAPPIKKKRGFCLPIIGGLFALVVVAAILRPKTPAQPTSQLITKTSTVASGNSTGGVDSPNANPTDAPAPASGPTTYTIGQDIKVGDVRWKILDAKDAGQTIKSDNQFTKDVTTQGKYIIVRFEIENLSKEQLSFSDIEIGDSENRTFKSSSDFNVLMLTPENERCNFLEPLASNLPKTCQITFEVPQAAKGLKVVVGDLKAFTDDSALIELGF